MCIARCLLHARATPTRQDIAHVTVVVRRQIMPVWKQGPALCCRNVALAAEERPTLVLGARPRRHKGTVLVAAACAAPPWRPRVIEVDQNFTAIELAAEERSRLARPQRLACALPARGQWCGQSQGGQGSRQQAGFAQIESQLRFRGCAPEPCACHPECASRNRSPSVTA